MSLLLDLWREDGGRGEDFIEVLELLSGLVFIRIGHLLAIDLGYVWETIDDESTEKDGVWDFIVFDRKGV